MSKENVKKFYDAAVKDTTIQEGLKELGAKFQGTSENGVKALIAFATSKGYKFGAADLKNFEKFHTKQLSEKELDQVSAGKPVPRPYGFSK